MNGARHPWVLGGALGGHGAVSLKQHNDSMGCLKIIPVAGNDGGEETEAKSPLMPKKI